MIQSEQINELAAALAKAQGELENITKDKEVNAGGRGSWRYADLGDGLDEIREKLSKHGLSFVQMTSFDDAMICISTQIMHNSGQWIRGTYPVSGHEQAHQQVGAAITYARRYSLFAAVGLVGVNDDDDGESAGKAPGPPVAGKARLKVVDRPVVDPEESAAMRNGFERDLDNVSDMKAFDELVNTVRMNEARLTPPDRKILAQTFNKKRAELEAK